MKNEIPNPDLDPAGETVRLTGRVLYLTGDKDLVRRQLDGEDIDQPPTSALTNGISTDEIIPNKVCLGYTGKETGELGKHFLTGYRGGEVAPGDIQNGGFEALVAGSSFGRGSSRIHAQIALAEAGIHFIIAEPERIFEENCVSVGITVLPPDDPRTAQLLSGEALHRDDLYTHYPPLQGAIAKMRGILPFFQALESGKVSPQEAEPNTKPMTITEKIVSKHTSTSLVLPSVSPGDELILTPDRYYGYELQTTAVRNLLKQLPKDLPHLKSPSKLTLFADHTALMPEDDIAVETQRREQEDFANGYKNLGLDHFGKLADGGVEGICHTIMLERGLPGEVILGNDSHTCTLGAINSLAIGKGAPELAGAMAFDKMYMQVPKTIRFELKGKLKTGVSTKDAMLTILSMPYIKSGGGSRKVFEFGGEGFEHIEFDDQIVFSNMAIEGQAFTGILEPNTPMKNFLKQKHKLSDDELNDLLVYGDPSASYNQVVEVNLGSIEPTVAAPGDTQNGVPLSEVEKKKIKIDVAYIGSCTHGKVEDLKQAAEVLAGEKVPEHVKLFVQASSLQHLNEAAALGYIKTIADAGATILLPGCGACMNAGPGATKEGEVGIFATNRNFPGRTGKGDTWLASPAVVAASALNGFISAPKKTTMQP